MKSLNPSKRWNEILSVALEIIHRKGYFNLTIRNIADKIGISEAAIYRHFKNKEEIISELCNLVFAKNKFWCKKTSIKNPQKLLQDIMLNQLKILIENPYLSAILFQEDIFTEYPKIKIKINQHRNRNENILKDIINEGQKNFKISPKINPSVFAILYMGSIRILVLKWRESNFSYPMDEEAKQVLKQLLDFISIR
ncbi:MAG: TetR/AcrR family transcriptional regulator [Atribacterota bacterium]|nr:TetR/AcrR family transcriptional regulator [Atribacterota bacterium]MDD4895153.1 TetR/AcrR family transcriptional regulator [Atribacterota bacterium]MDD5637198.1 TetR/AcrR family transcriptional regulator [Atribacterota bacterium]